MAVRIISAQRTQQTSAAQPSILRVAAYARVSTDHEEQETSYEAQVNHYTNYISNHVGWTLVAVYADEGITGTSTAKREQFNQMIRDCEDGKIDMVITKSISRWARNTLDSLSYIRKLKALGIPVIFEKENINTMGSSGELLLTIMSSLAQQESQSISQNVRMGIQYSFQQGKPMLCHSRFLGYTKNPGKTALTIVPEEAEHVRRIFRLFLEGYGTGEIAREMERLGIKSPGGGEHWVQKTVQSMLKNEKYMGDLLLQKSFTEDFLTKKNVKNEGQFPQYYVENAHPPIVPKEVFMRVQGELMRQEQVKQETGKRLRTTHSLALFGKVKCGECGSLYRRYIGYQKNEPNKWRCKTRVSRYHACTGRMVTEEELFQTTVIAFNRLPEQRENLIRMEERILWGPLDRVSREIDAIDSRKKELEGIISDYAASGHMDRRTLFLFGGDTESETTVESALDGISEELASLDEKRDELLCQKGDLGIQEANVHSLLKLTNALMRAEGAPDGAGDIERPAACYDIADFYERTDRMTQWGPLREYNDALVKRFVECFIVQQNGILVQFKAGVDVNVMTPQE